MHATKYLAESAVVRTGPGRLLALIVVGGADAAATATAYDHATAATGDPIMLLSAPATMTVVFALDAGIACSKGIYVALTGTGGKAVAVYA